MTVLKYINRPYDTTHENEFFEKLYFELDNSEILQNQTILLFGNILCNGSEIDALLIKSDAIIVLEFKDYGGHLTFSENGPWFIDNRINVGAANNINPLQQLRKYKNAISDFLSKNDKEGKITKNNVINWRHIDSLVVFQKPINYDNSVIPGALRASFGITDVNNVVQSITSRKSKEIHFSETEFSNISQLFGFKINKVKVKKPENIDKEKLADYLAQLYLFKTLRLEIDHKLNQVRSFNFLLSDYIKIKLQREEEELKSDLNSIGTKINSEANIIINKLEAEGFLKHLVDEINIENYYSVDFKSLYETLEIGEIKIDLKHYDLFKELLYLTLFKQKIYSNDLVNLFWKFQFLNISKEKHSLFYELNKSLNSILSVLLINCFQNNKNTTATGFNLVWKRKLQPPAQRSYYFSAESDLISSSNKPKIPENEILFLIRHLKLLLGNNFDFYLKVLGLTSLATNYFDFETFIFKEMNSQNIYVVKSDKDILTSSLDYPRNEDSLIIDFIHKDLFCSLFENFNVESNNLTPIVETINESISKFISEWKKPFSIYRIWAGSGYSSLCRYVFSFIDINTIPEHFLYKDKSAIYRQTRISKELYFHLKEKFPQSCLVDVYNSNLEPLKEQPIDTMQKPKHTLLEPQPIHELENLDTLIGLEQVKREIHNLINVVKIRKEKLIRGLKVTPATLHLVFTGNPGTGKTIVARMIGKIYLELGLLKRGHCVEVSRAELVGEYIGHTAPKTTKKFNEAIGGVLFIDEAYSLTQGTVNDFGKEAVSTLLKLMEDSRDEIVVIVAGYPNEMDIFMKSNPGLKSRFPTNINFADYGIEEKILILEKYCNESNFKLSVGAKEKTTLLMENFSLNSNARSVRNLFELIIKNQAVRLSKLMGNYSNEQLITFEQEDIPDNYFDQ